MKTPKSTPADPVADRDRAGAAAALESEPDTAEPEIEPRTPERVLAWNSYYDLYVAGGVLLLVFIAASHDIVNPGLWTHLKSGQLIAQQGPLSTDPFTYTLAGRPWINTSWLFDLIAAQLYGLGATIRNSQADRAGAGVLIVVSALLRALGALALLAIRRNGPGLWWNAIVTALALGIVIGPLGPAVGGLAQRTDVSPETFGLFLMCVLLWTLHRGLVLGRRASLFAVVPLFALWANLDRSFALGLIVAACALLGGFGQRIVRSKTTDDDEAPAPAPIGLRAAVLALSVVACIANPYHIQVFQAGFAPLLDWLGSTPILTQDQLSLFGAESRDYFESIDPTGRTYRKLVAYFILAVGSGIGSFLLNWRRFSLGRFATFVVTAALWALLFRNNTFFAPVWAACLALNGQEWYHDTFGTQGKTSIGWSIWSIGGRLVSLGLVFFAVIAAITGLANQLGEPLFGFAYDPDEFAFESASYLSELPLEGQVLNLALAHGDAINWKAYPTRKPFLDTRKTFQSAELLQEVQAIRKALVSGLIDQWQPLLDKYKISTLMLGMQRESANLYDTLSKSPDWVPFYDDGQVMLFGRLDEKAPEADRKLFAARRLDAETLAYGEEDPTKPFAGPPNPTGWYDQIFQTRALTAQQYHVAAAQRWLDRSSGEALTTSTGPSISQALLAIREARDALSTKPDDPDAYFVLAGAYQILGLSEAQLVLPPGTNLATLPNPPVLQIRVQQRLTAINFAIQTAPPPQSPEARAAVRELRVQAYGLYQNQGYLDLARDQLEAAIKLTEPGEKPDPEAQRALEQLDEALAQLKDQIDQADIQQPLDPLQRAQALLQGGAVGQAITELEAAENAGLSAASVRWQLVDLYCQTGQPDRASPLMSAASIDDPNLSTGPGTAAYRLGKVFFLLGNYESARQLWGSFAIPALEASRSQALLQSAIFPTRGGFANATRVMLDLPTQVNQLAEWNLVLGLCELESGRPKEAVKPLTEVLRYDPDNNARPIVAYYLGKLKAEVPPLPTPEAESATPEAKPAEPAPETPKPNEAKPEEPKPAEAKPEEPKPAEPAPAEPKAEEPKTEAPKPAEPKAEEPKADAPKPAEPKAEEPKAEEPKADTPPNR